MNRNEDPQIAESANSRKTLLVLMNDPQRRDHTRRDRRRLAVFGHRICCGSALESSPVLIVDSQSEQSHGILVADLLPVVVTDLGAVEPLAKTGYALAPLRGFHDQRTDFPWMGNQ
jgi:hypothetical protein